MRVHSNAATATTIATVPHSDTGVASAPLLTAPLTNIDRFFVLVGTADGGQERCPVFTGRWRVRGARWNRYRCLNTHISKPTGTESNGVKYNEEEAKGSKHTKQNEHINIAN